MFPALPCPDWDYKTHPHYHGTMPRRESELRDALAKDKETSANTAIDTRKAHETLFGDLVPAGCEYYAGHYRGEEYPCLKFCRVGIPGDRRVGIEPHRVALAMLRLSSAIRDTMDALDGDEPITTNQGLLRLVNFIAANFVDLLTVHPYRDGNGHAARTMLYAILVHYGFQPVWSIDKRPPEPEYSTLISSYRSGHSVPLVRCILQWLLPAP